MSRVKKALRSQGGFTLIELLIVVVILGILAAIAIPQIAGLVGQADIGQVESNMRTLMTDLEAHRARGEDRTFPHDHDSLSDLDGDQNFDSGAITALVETEDDSESVTEENVEIRADSYKVELKLDAALFDDEESDVTFTIEDGNFSRETS